VRQAVTQEAAVVMITKIELGDRRNDEIVHAAAMGA